MELKKISQACRISDLKLVNWLFNPFKFSTKNNITYISIYISELAFKCTSFQTVGSEVLFHS